MRSYTDIEQSKKLAEILPLETADGFWEYHDKWSSEGDEWEGYEDYPRAEPYLEYTRKENEWKEDKSDVPCWSLTALLNTTPQIKIRGSKKIGYIVYYNKNIASNRSFDIIDACYELILKLNESNLL
jgi:hypothetical protein